MDLDLLARKLPAEGITVMRYEQPWRLAGRKVATPPPQLDIGWRGGVDCVGCGRAAHRRAVLRWPQRRVPGSPAGPRRTTRSPVSSASRSRCTCPDAPRSRGQRTARPRTCRAWCSRAPRTRSARRTRSGPSPAQDPGIVLVELPGADHSYRTREGRRAFTPADLRAPPGRVGDGVHRVLRLVTPGSLSNQTDQRRDGAPKKLSTDLARPPGARGRSDAQCVRVHARRRISPQLSPARAPPGRRTDPRASVGVRPGSELASPAGRGGHLAADQSRSVLRVRLARLLDREGLGRGAHWWRLRPSRRACRRPSPRPGRSRRPGHRRSRPTRRAVRESTGPGASCARATAGEIHARQGARRESRSTTPCLTW